MSRSKVASVNFFSQQKQADMAHLQNIMLDQKYKEMFPEKMRIFQGERIFRTKEDFEHYTETVKKWSKCPSLI